VEEALARIILAFVESQQSTSMSCDESAQLLSLSLEEQRNIRCALLKVDIVEAVAAQRLALIVACFT
jgi:hypothetical protein